ncbi:MAG: 2-hydroxyglutaryl-CoA dehydratase [Syntrophaceae bacterium CG2_30_49_12]|nr:MAG: 2-hydroxyglutaryl-CoA dehydratase [Syntrophaceae bacterium CG2_30_49_12]PIP07794.1 MAG: 2-hydroxyglutaryl-CoA dehydratase [Syntrophobacterales bacterium CG23_combo_of_CG06-09_8_20_14_all_48_27]PJC73204.1 MAG: 2-hydroxyglutaryl-CoA dehydratase [Syntrophobacterales bacterium CG_4_8_14_3_um_filter_49_14]
MTFTAGVDVGSLCTKVVILNSEKEIKSYAILRSGAVYRGAAEAALDEALKKAGLDAKELSYIVSTGYGRSRVAYANNEITEISCHARGANFISAEIRTVIDIGGQDSKVIQLNEKGQAVRFVMNDKCAAGTGRFLEVMAGALEVDLDEMSEISFQAREDIEVSSMCTVFAESEVISLFASGYTKPEIAGAIYRSIARRVTGLVGQLGLKERVAMTGGVAKSKGMVRALEAKLGLTLIIPPEPQIIGALGAALFAYDKAPSCKNGNSS